MRTIELNRRLFDLAVSAAAYNFPRGEPDHPGYGIADEITWGELQLALAYVWTDLPIVVLRLSEDQCRCWRAAFDVTADDDPEDMPIPVSDADCAAIRAAIGGT